MAQTTLVDSDIELGQRIVQALAAAKVPVTAAVWVYFPQLGEGQFHLFTPLVDKRGGLGAYREVFDALRRSDLFADVPFRRILLKSPKEQSAAYVKKLHRITGNKPIRLTEQMLGDEFVSEAYVYPGALHIVRVGGAKGNGKYAVGFAPYDRGGGAMRTRTFTGMDPLKEFLFSLRLEDQEVDEAIAEVRGKGVTTIMNLNLPPAKLKRSGLL